MKHLLLLSSLILWCVFVFGQKKLTKAYFSPTFKIKKFGLSIGQDQDMPFGLDHNYLLQTARLGGNIDVSALSQDRDYSYSMICENPHLRFDVEFLLPHLKNTTVTFGVYSITGRIDVANYNKNEVDTDGNSIYRHLGIRSYSNELGVESSLLRYVPISRHLRLFGGAGTNLGFSYDGSISVDADNIDILKDDEVSFRAVPTDMGNIDPDEYYTNSYYEYFDQKNGIHQRAFLHAGIGLTMFKRMELQWAYRSGLGYRFIQGAPLKFTQLRSITMGMKWVLY